MVVRVKGRRALQAAVEASRRDVEKVIKTAIATYIAETLSTASGDTVPPPPDPPRRVRVVVEVANPAPDLTEKRLASFVQAAIEHAQLSLALPKERRVVRDFSYRHAIYDWALNTRVNSKWFSKVMAYEKRTKK